MFHFCLLLMSDVATPRPAAAEPRGSFVLVIHGGAGVIPRAEMTPEKEAEYRRTLEESLRAGSDVLRTNGTALNAVIAAIKVLEDSPLFNAGRGAVLNSAGEVELDAAIMDGAKRNAGTIAAVKHIRNPIELARLVMDKSPHVMLVGAGAEAFATEQGMALVPQDYFIIEDRRKQLERIQRQQRSAPKPQSIWQMEQAADLFGTVGAVALDKHGNLAAGTSTGGIANKKPGRVGDSPIIGAGTYANNATCAVSATGHGEYFIRAVVAHDISALVEYQGLSLSAAADLVVKKKLIRLHGGGGLIALDRKGNIAMPFNTQGMYRGFVRDGKTVVEIYPVPGVP
jgi:beta-aspartyl-peptidase (threonine type)